MYCRSMDPYKIEHTKFFVLIVPVLKDNYAYLVVDKQSQLALAVDPAEVPPSYFCRILISAVSLRAPSPRCPPELTASSPCLRVMACAAIRRTRSWVPALPASQSTRS